MEIVGLKFFVQDDVNKLIAKFVCQSKPAQIMRNVFNTCVFIDGGNYLRSNGEEIWERRYAYAMNEGQKLMLIKSIPNRRNKFEQLPQWIRKLLIIWRRNLLFPSMNAKTRQFIDRQISLLNFKQFTTANLF